MKRPRVVDPTKNVLDLVRFGRKADHRYQAGMLAEVDRRLALHTDYIHRLKTQEFSMQDAARHAETKRLDEALRLRDEHDNRMSTMILSRSEATDSAVASRLDRLEQFMFTQSGKGQGLSNVWAIALGLATLASVGIALYAALH